MARDHRHHRNAVAVGARGGDDDRIVGGLVKDFELRVGAHIVAVKHLHPHAIGQIVGIGVGEGDDFSLEPGAQIATDTIPDIDQGLGKAAIGLAETGVGQGAGIVTAAHIAEILVIDEALEAFPIVIGDGGDAGLIDHHIQTCRQGGRIQRRR